MPFDVTVTGMGANVAANPSPLRIGQFSAYHGDRPDGMRELLDSGVDVLAGDYLAELTMLVLRKNQMRGGPGYARAFVDQLADNLEQVAERGVKVVTNAGGLDPEQCAADIRELCRQRGVDLVVAAVVGDDLREGLADLLGPQAVLPNLDTGQDLMLAEHEVLTANAYLGAWPIVVALQAGADIVVCPRVTDASLVVGPAAWHFGWARDEWDRLAGAVVAGHLIECGAQVTGGNFALFHEYGDLGLPGMPIAEVAADGSSIITKSAGSGGVVSIDSVKAQLFYEIGGSEYHNPDVITDLSSVQLTDLGDDRVQVAGVRGRPPTETTKLSLTYEGGYRNSMTVGVTGTHLKSKLAWLRSQVERTIGGPEDFDGFRWTVIGPAREVDGDQAQATAWVVVTVRDKDRAKVSRSAFADRIVQLGTSSIPGFYLTTPPQRERLFGVQWPCLIAKKHLRTVVRLEGSPDIEVAWGPWSTDARSENTPTVCEDRPPLSGPSEPTIRAPLGDVIATRSGDKGGTANLGVWAQTSQAFDWLRTYLTPERLAELLPELEGLRIERHDLPNLWGVNFLVFGYLEDGVSSCTRIDPQAKGLGEYLASRIVDIPQSVLANAHATRPEPPR